MTKIRDSKGREYNSMYELMNSQEVTKKDHRVTRFTIYQIPKGSTTDYEFMSWSFAKDHGFDKKDYSSIYTDTINSVEHDYILEKLFTIFNINRPADFKGHSLSVSDIVELVDYNEGTNNLTIKYYYCDSFGWQDITAEVGGVI